MFRNLSAILLELTVEVILNKERERNICPAVSENQLTGPFIFDQVKLLLLFATF